MAMDHVSLDNATMYEVIHGLHALGQSAQGRLDQMTNYHAQFLSTSHGQYADGGDQIMMQAKAYFTHIVDVTNNLAVQVERAVGMLNSGDSHANSLFGSALGG